MSKTAVITGATSGIGAAYAKRLAADGYDLIITGRRKEIIEKLADDLSKQHDIKIEMIIAELSDDKDIQKVVDAISSADDLEMLINNAGYYEVYKNCMEAELTNHEKMIKVHQITPMRLIYAVLPTMTKNRKGSIINISSIGAYGVGPQVYIYAATKAFLKIFSEGLYLELKDKGINVQVVCPPFVQTDFYRKLTDEQREEAFGAAKWFTISSDALVNYSLKFLKKNKPICLPGARYKFSAYLFQTMPRNLLYKMTAKMTEI